MQDKPLYIISLETVSKSEPAVPIPPFLSQLMLFSKGLIGSFKNTVISYTGMGRIKTMLIKRTAHKLVANHKHEFKKDFDENKQVVGRFTEIPSKKLRNAVAGYITRLMNAGK